MSWSYFLKKVQIFFIYDCLKSMTAEYRVNFLLDMPIDGHDTETMDLEWKEGKILGGRWCLIGGSNRQHLDTQVCG